MGEISKEYRLYHNACKPLAGERGCLKVGLVQVSITGYPLAKADEINVGIEQKDGY